MHDFENLTPDRFLDFLEKALDTRLTALARPMPSYINRVYEVMAFDRTPYIAKFYRPGRWTQEAIEDEHAFIRDCAEVEIPVVPPLTLTNGTTLDRMDEICFAVFPKRSGRQYDIERDEDWKRVGSLLGRIHNVGSRRAAEHRLTLAPALSRRYLEQLCGDAVGEKWRQPYKDIVSRIIDTLEPLFEGVQTFRVHGDFRPSNILHRPEEGLMVIDFDDMVNGPAAQDFWLLLPEHYPGSSRYVDLLLSGYRTFRDFHPKDLRLIEGLRAMHMVYFTTWCYMQRNDFQFQKKFPDWGSDSFWAKEVQDMRTQFANIMDAMYAE